MIHIGIIGGGFAGSMLSNHLINNYNNQIKITLIDEKGLFGTGIAYKPYSKNQLLNVISSKMSAFPNEPMHFVNWLKEHVEYKETNSEILENSFLPRYIYGEYLISILDETIKLAKKKGIEFSQIESTVKEIEELNNQIILSLPNGEKINVDKCILATGNYLPKNPITTDKEFITNKNYFQNPWDIESVCNLNNKLPVLIIGNGLTMVDTVIGLIEKGFKNEIYSISPNGFNILPHRHNGLKYKIDSSFITEENISFKDLVKFIIEEIKKIRKLGVSAEPIIDSLRPYTALIWQKMSIDEKLLFFKKYRHFWGVARHRIPMHIHDKIQYLKIQSKLIVISGNIENIENEITRFKITLFDKKLNKAQNLNVQRIINCTGPNSDFQTINNSFWPKLICDGLVVQDKLKLGINTDIQSFRTINKYGHLNKNLFAVGSLLKGELWETTAVNEIRNQVIELSNIILSKNDIN